MKKIIYIIVAFIVSAVGYAIIKHNWTQKSDNVVIQKLWNPTTKKGWNEAGKAFGVTKGSTSSVCKKDKDCNSGNCVAGLCQRKVKDGGIGSSCTSNSNCKSDNCMSGLCQRKLGLGGPCSNDGQCKSGKCTDSGPGLPGICSECDGPDGCFAENMERMRVKDGQIGSICTSNSNCNSGNCMSGLCQSKLGLGGPCSNDGQCKSGKCTDSGPGLPGICSECDGPGGCSDENMENLRVKDGQIGAICRSNKDCNSGNCYGGLCQRKVTYDFCSNDGQCASGKCRNGVCARPSSHGRKKSQAVVPSQNDNDDEEPTNAEIIDEEIA